MKVFRLCTFESLRDLWKLPLTRYQVIDRRVFCRRQLCDCNQQFQCSFPTPSDTTNFPNFQCASKPSRDNRTGPRIIEWLSTLWPCSVSRGFTVDLPLSWALSPSDVVLRRKGVTEDVTEFDERRMRARRPARDAATPARAHGRRAPKAWANKLWFAGNPPADTAFMRIERTSSIVMSRHAKRTRRSPTPALSFSALICDDGRGRSMHDGAT